MSTRSEIPLHPVNDPMEMAFSLASEALKAGEVPVGCVFVYRGAVIASGRNEVNALKNAVKHAEIVAIQNLERWCTLNDVELGHILSECDLYVTVEPCIMCAAALRFALPVQPRSIVFGAKNERFGGCGSVADIDSLPLGSTSSLSCLAGMQETRSISMLKQFYAQENLNAPEDVRRCKSSVDTKRNMFESTG
ncbi:tRNA specific adenosine deaminase [Fasciolopsis buskii]|uniref:tRNA specific adenosine deaminase n=1 Tax=Fasciolopsis buskii TaxID=27845 RepID=A0A8E0RLV0_9TREM|nr:tRNA specific adenosine deaminase [Fasciolopsis buski]